MSHEQVEQTPSTGYKRDPESQRVFTEEASSTPLKGGIKQLAKFWKSYAPPGQGNYASSSIIVGFESKHSMVCARSAALPYRKS